MSWKEQNAIKRIYNTFKRVQKGIFNEDVEALKILKDNLDYSAKQTAEDNLLYAKLLAIHLRQTFEYFGDIKLTIKKVKDELEIPLEAHLQFLEKKMNDIELKNYIESLGIKIDFETYEDLEKNKANIKEHQKEIINKMKSTWSYDTVEKSFYNTANTFLKDVNNYR